MNNYTQLVDCLNSIKQHTKKTSYEVILVAYFFSEANLRDLRNAYPWIKIVISNEIRGFSANNNLGIAKAQGEYCFILNDDTSFATPVIDDLYTRAISDKNIAILSPKIVNADGTIQYCGMNPITWSDWIKSLYRIKKEIGTEKGRWVKDEGFFQTYNILGAAFLIKTSVLRELGCFDERYFFGPEDRALSTLANKKGYKCFVDANIKLTHYGGSTGGPTTTTIRATKPANVKGRIIFFAENNKCLYYFLCILVWINSLMGLLTWMAKSVKGDPNAKNMYLSHINICKTVFNNQNTTEVFKRFYKHNQ